MFPDKEITFSHTWEGTCEYNFKFHLDSAGTGQEWNNYENMQYIGKMWWGQDWKRGKDQKVLWDIIKVESNKWWVMNMI